MPSKARPTGGIEQYSYFRDRFNCYRNIVCYAEFSSDITRQHLFLSLRSLISEVNGLAVNTRNEGSVICPLETIKFGDVAEFRQIDDHLDVEKTISQLHDLRFPVDTDKPLWKVVVYGENRVFFVSDHTICDGRGLAYFMSGLTDHLNLTRGEKAKQQELKVSEDSAVFELGQIERFYITDSLEKYVTKKKSASFIFHTIVENVGPRWMARIFRTRHLYEFDLSGKPLPIPDNISPSMHTQVEVVRIGKPVLDNLLQTGKKHDVKLTVLLVYLIAKILKKIVIESDPHRYKATENYDLEYAIPVDGRSFVDVKEVQNREPDFVKGFGNFASSVSLKTPSAAISLDPNTIDWPLVRAMQKKLADMLAKKENLSLLGVLSFVDVKDYIKGLSDQRNKAFEGHYLEVSNLGYFKFNEKVPEDGFQVKDVIFSQSVCVTGALIDANVIGFENGLRIALGWDTNLPFAKSVNGIAETVRTSLENVK